MNLDELKPLWKSYKEQTGEHYKWSPTDIEHLLKTSQKSVSWYGRSPKILTYVCLSLPLLILTGC